MIPRIVVHAGGPKTGSGSIQRAFNPRKPQISQDLLEKLGFQFLFSKNGITSNQGGLVTDISAGHLSDTEVVEWRQFFLSQYGRLTNPESKLFVFSAERMGAPRLTSERSARVAEFINTLGIVKQVVYYARPIMPLALSLGLQRAKNGKTRAIDMMTQVNPQHIVNKHMMFSSGYDQAEINFRRFDRHSLGGSDVRIDIASQLCKSGESISDLEKQLSLVSSANEKIDLPMLLLLKKLYREAGFGEKIKVPQVFINFITMGKWAGLPCTHADLYTSDEIEAMYQLSILEVSSLQSAGTNSSLQRIGDYFQDSLRPKDHYMARRGHVNDLDAYSFSLTEAQRNIIRIMLSKMRKLSLRRSAEFKALLPLESETSGAQYCASEMLPVILRASLLVS